MVCIHCPQLSICHIFHRKGYHICCRSSSTNHARKHAYRNIPGHLCAFPPNQFDTNWYVTLYHLILWMFESNVFEMATRQTGETKKERDIVSIGENMTRLSGSL